MTAGAAPCVLIAYDGSPSAATAVQVAASLFPDAGVSVVTVPEDPALHSATGSAMLSGVSLAPVGPVIDELIDAVRRAADATAQQGVDRARSLGANAEPISIRPAGPAWATLLDAARRAGADVLVCGTRGRGAFARALLGSTSSSLLHHADLPLLIVPDGGGALDGPVVVAYDGSDGSEHAIRATGRLLHGHAAVVVHGWEPMFHRALAERALVAGAVDNRGEVMEQLHQQLAGGAAATTEQGVAAARRAGLQAEGETVEVEQGVWRAVAAAARVHHASVIAMGSRGLGMARSVLLGSVSSGLVQNAELPVLVVPAEPQDAVTGQDGRTT